MAWPHTDLASCRDGDFRHGRRRRVPLFAPRWATRAEVVIAPRDAGGHIAVDGEDFGYPERVRITTCPGAARVLLHAGDGV